MLAQGRNWPSDPLITSSKFKPNTFDYFNVHTNPSSHLECIQSAVGRSSIQVVAEAASKCLAMIPTPAYAYPSSILAVAAIRIAFNPKLSASTSAR